jgi:hypothetical protein
MLLREYLSACVYMRLSHTRYVGSINEANPALNFGEDTTEALLHTLVNLRDIIMCECKPSYEDTMLVSESPTPSRPTASPINQI